MHCIIDQTIQKALKKGRRAQTIVRFLRMRYRIQADIETIKARMQQAKSSLSQKASTRNADLA